MNVAVVFAGGTGQRMNTKTKPKQFLELHGKPIIVYTLELFQQAPSIDKIVVVMLESWIDYTYSLIDRYQISKVSAVIPGGKTGQESIFCGISKAHELFPGDSVVLIHDGVRPLIDVETIEKCIECTRKNGNAITASPVIETVALTEEDGTIQEVLPRNQSLVLRAPQCFILGEIYDNHLKANKEGKKDFIDSASLMRFYGCKLFAVKGPNENIKITTPSDFYTFRAISDAKEDSQIFGF